jgi:hypothetical protein
MKLMKIDLDTAQKFALKDSLMFEVKEARRWQGIIW